MCVCVRERERPAGRAKSIRRRGARHDGAPQALRLGQPNLVWGNALPQPPSDKVTPLHPLDRYCRLPSNRILASRPHPHARARTRTHARPTGGSSRRRQMTWTEPHNRPRGGPPLRPRRGPGTPRTVKVETTLRAMREEGHPYDRLARERSATLTAVREEGLRGGPLLRGGAAAVCERGGPLRGGPLIGSAWCVCVVGLHVTEETWTSWVCMWRKRSCRVS